MNLSTAVILGIVQGFTELFPVSSSAHLVILQSFFPDFNQPGVAFDVMLHLGTLLSVIIYFFGDIRNIIRSILFPRHPVDADTADPTFSRRLFFFLMIGTIPVAITGILFRENIHSLFESARFAALFLIVTGFLLFFSDRVKRTHRTLQDLTIKDSIFIGLAQAVALLPGISRSGATITAGIFSRIHRQDAARFSFLLSIPAVLGAVILEAGYLPHISLSDVWLYVVGFICSALSGWISLKLFFLVIHKARLKYFACYCWTLGVATLMFIAG